MGSSEADRETKMNKENTSDQEKDVRKGNNKENKKDHKEVASAEIQQILRDMKLPEYGEIPDVGLYLEQVIRFINRYLENFPEMQVTPSMISNYVKLKIVAKPVRKTYSREQIARFLFIVLAKTVLSMDNIRKVFDIQEASYGPEASYEYFRKMLGLALDAFTREPGISEKEVLPNREAPKRESSSSEERYMMDCTASAIAHKMYLNLYFSCNLVKK